MIVKYLALVIAAVLAVVPIDVCRSQESVAPVQTALPPVAVSPKPDDADFPQPSPSGRHNEKTKTVQSGDYNLVLLGDSITECIGDAGGEWEPIKAVWKKHYEPRKTINLGFGWDRIQNVLWRMDHGSRYRPQVV